MASRTVGEPVGDHALDAEDVVLGELEMVVAVDLLRVTDDHEPVTEDRSLSAQEQQSASALETQDSIRGDIAGEFHITRLLLVAACRDGELEVFKTLFHQEPAAVGPVWPPQDSLLHIACEHGHYQIVKWLIENGNANLADLESQNAFGLTPLMVAAVHHRLGIADFLIAWGANVGRLQDLRADFVRECAKNGNTNMLAFLLGHGVGGFEGDASISSLIQVAALGGHIRAVQLLLSLRAFGSPDLGACVAAAVQSQDAELVQLLCSSGADVNAADENRGTPLSYAIELRDLAIVEVLLHNGADLRKRIWKPMDFENGGSVLDYMIREGELEMVKLVQRIRGASAVFDLADNSHSLRVAASHGRVNIVKFLLSVQPPSFCINTVKRPDTPALTSAALHRQLKVVQLLVEHGANVNLTTMNGYTAVVHAARRGHYEVVQWLCEHGADVEIASSANLTALCAAAQHGFADIVENLMEESGVSSNVVTAYTMTPMGGAIANDHLDVVRVLLAHDEYRDRDHPNLLGEALVNHHVELVKLLARHVGDVNVDFCEEHRLSNTDRYVTFNLKLPPLAIAAALGDLELVKFLCEQGADVEAITDMGETALFLAVEKGNLDVVTYLVEDRNANVNCSNSAPFSFTAVEVARNRGHDAVVQFLCEHGASRPRKVIMEFDDYEAFAEDGDGNSVLTRKEWRDVEYWDRKQVIEKLFEAYIGCGKRQHGAQV